MKVILTEITVMKSLLVEGTHQQRRNTIASGDSASAIAILNGWTSQNRVDDNYKTYYNWLLQHANYTKSTDQPNVDVLLSIAKLCPFTDGQVVYAARNLYNGITGRNEQFYGACATNNTVSQKAKKANIKTATTNNNLKVYPNPSNGNITIQLPTDKDAYAIKLTDIYGKLILEKLVSNYTSYINLNLKVSAGMYLMYLHNTKTGKQEVTQIIIQ